MERGFGVGVFGNWLTYRLHYTDQSVPSSKPNFPGDFRSRKRQVTKNSEEKAIRGREHQKEIGISELNFSIRFLKSKLNKSISHLKFSTMVVRFKLVLSKLDLSNLVRLYQALSLVSDMTVVLPHKKGNHYLLNLYIIYINFKDIFPLIFLNKKIFRFQLLFLMKIKKIN